MLTSLKLWNEPNNVSHWDLQLDPGWRRFSDMVRRTVARLRGVTRVPIVLGGISPVDPRFLRTIAEQGALDGIDVLALHGFPLDWNLWPMEEWPAQIGAIRGEFGRPVWVTETGVSSFVSEEKAAWGLRRMSEILHGEKVFWYSLLDLAPDVEATTRHRRAEGSGYFRHYHFGLLRHDGTPKRAVADFTPELGICQWVQFGDARTLDLTACWLERLRVSQVRIGLSWAESHMLGAWQWFDRIMDTLAPFDLCVTLCFTPPSQGIRPHHTSPPRDPDAFADFAVQVAQRYGAAVQSRPARVVAGG